METHPRLLNYPCRLGPFLQARLAPLAQVLVQVRLVAQLAVLVPLVAENRLVVNCLYQVLDWVSLEVWVFQGMKAEFYCCRFCCRRMLAQAAC